MSETVPACRREEGALCDPHNAAVKQPKTPPAAVKPAAAEHPKACEQQTMTEKQFLRDHTFYSAISSWLFAIAGATNIGVLCAFSSKLLSAVENGKPIFKAPPPVKAPPSIPEVKPITLAQFSELLLDVKSGKITLKETTPIWENKPAPVDKPVLGNKKYNIIALSMMAFGGICMAVSNWLESKKVVTEWQLGAGKLQRKAAGAEREQAKIAPVETNDDPPPAAKQKNWATSVKQKEPEQAERAFQKA